MSEFRAHRRARPALACLFAFLASATSAEVIEIGPGDDVRAAIADLEPGDELVLRGGRYGFGSRFNVTVVGTVDQPIVIRGKSGETALIEMTTSTQNVLELQGSRYVVLRDLAFTGGSHGIRLMDSDFVTIENNEIFETGDVALSANSGGTYEGLVIRANHIHHTNGTGEGMYLGCNSNACRVIDSLVELNYIHHTNRPSVEQGDGIELKEGSAGNVIRHNVIHDTNYPGIITYSTRGNGPANIVEGNVIWNTNDNGIQSAADAVIRNNIVLGSAIALQPHEGGSPSNHVVVHNTVVVSSGGGINVRSASGSVIVANNAVYAASDAAIRVIGDANSVTLAGNVGTGGLSGVGSGFVEGHGIAADFVDGHYRGAPPIDLFPIDSSALIGAGSPSYAVAEDFNGTKRNGTVDAGAYAFAPGGNPGWALTSGFKIIGAGHAPPNPPTNLKVR